MKLQQLRSRKDETILYEGRFETPQECLEEAVSNRVALDCVDLRNLNLSNANLDDAIMPNADLSFANLSGANMSEAYLRGSNFSGAALYNTCFYDSNLSACDFTDTSFGATDIFGTILSHSQFSTLSCFSLEFSSVRQMSGCIFINPDGRICRMSKPPVVVSGVGAHKLILMDDHAKTGHNLIDHARLKPLIEKLSTRTLRRRLSA